MKVLEYSPTCEALSRKVRDGPVNLVGGGGRRSGRMTSELFFLLL